MRIGFIRPPSASYYNDTHVREDNQITYALGYADKYALAHKFKVYDFPLQRNLTIDDILAEEFDVFVVSARETGSSIHYALRLARIIKKHGGRVVLYGQVSRLRHLKNIPPVEIVETNEQHLFAVIGGKASDNDLVPQPLLDFRPIPYVYELGLPALQMRRFKAALESTRGCQFRCRFCYINYRRSDIQRWIKKSNDSIQADIDVYYEHGVRNFIFMDSEFFGHDAELYADRRELLKILPSRFPEMKFMIYCRADTLRSFNDYDALRTAGLYNVLIGVESFSSTDLKAMKKGQYGESIEDSIRHLLDHDINMTISMITFNRSTTVQSLRNNIQALRRLHEHPNAQGLGMPNFVFNLEASWDTEVPGESLSKQSYVRWLMFFKDQPIGQRVVVDAALEPLMEIYRVMLYEIATQVSRMATVEHSKESVKLWYECIGMFIVDSMERYLNRFESGILDDISANIEEWYAFMTYFNKRTRPSMDSVPITKSETLASYKRGWFDYEDHGWDSYIPVQTESIKNFLES